MEESVKKIKLILVYLTAPIQDIKQNQEFLYQEIMSDLIRLIISFKVVEFYNKIQQTNNKDFQIIFQI